MWTGWTPPHIMLLFPEYSAWILALMMISGLHSKRISKTVILSEKYKWLDAEKACRRVGPDCHLAVGEGDDSIHWDISDSQQYWIGATRQRILTWKESGRPLFKETGCYKTSTSLGVAHTLPQNNPDECFQTCGTQFVALQNSTCFCVSAAVMSELVSSRRCYLSCSAAQCFYSGGLEELSVYELPNRTVFIRNDSRDNFYWRLDKGNTFVINKSSSKKTNHLCVDRTGKYESKKWNCTSGTKDVTFEEGTNMDELLKAVSNMTEALDGFFLPLSNRSFFWINRLPLKSVNGSGGGCVSLSKVDNNYIMHKNNCNKTKLPSICTCFTEHTELLTSEITTLKTTSVTQSTEVTAHALMTKTVTEGDDNSTPTATGASTTTLLTLVNFTSCSLLEENNGNGSRKITWPCGTQPGPALGSKRRDTATESSNKLTIIIAAAAAGGVVLIVAVVVTIYMRTCRGSKSSLIQRDKYGRVQYPI